jgi:hypothetical protein
MMPIRRLSAGNRTFVAALLIVTASLSSRSTAWSDDRSEAENAAASPAVDSEVDGTDTKSSHQTSPNSDAAEVRPQYVIGVQCSQADSLLRQHLKLGDRGLIVQDLIPNGPAAQSGLTTGDLIVSSGDTDLRTVYELMKVIQESGGRAVELSIIRSGEPMTISVVPQKRSHPEHSSDESAPVRQFHPGIIINRNSRTEDAHQILEQALKAAGMNSEWQLTPHQPAAPLPSGAHSVMQQEIATLREQIRMLMDRITALENNRTAGVPTQQPLSSPSEPGDDKKAGEADAATEDTD